MYSILDRDFFVFLILFWISVKRYLLYCCLDRNTSYFAKKNFDYYNFDAILGRHLIKCWRDLSRYFYGNFFSTVRLPWCPICWNHCSFEKWLNPLVYCWFHVANRQTNWNIYFFTYSGMLVSQWCIFLFIK